MSLAFFWDDQLSWDSKRFCDDAMWPWQNVENGKLNHQPYQLIFAWAWSESQKAHKAWEVTTVSRLVEIYSKFQADSWNIQNLGSIDHICIWNYCWWFRNAAVPLISYIYIYTNEIHFAKWEAQSSCSSKPQDNTDLQPMKLQELMRHSGRKRWRFCRPWTYCFVGIQTLC